MLTYIFFYIFTVKLKLCSLTVNLLCRPLIANFRFVIFAKFFFGSLNTKQCVRWSIYSDVVMLCVQSNDTDMVRVSFNTPGSRVDRELTTQFQLDRRQRQVQLDIKTPWKRVNVRGSLINTAELKKALLTATLDETTEYSISAELQVRLTLHTNVLCVLWFELVYCFIVLNCFYTSHPVQ